MNITPESLYKILFKYFRSLNWWPKDLGYHKKTGSDPRFEVIVGAILTQNTAWSNVELALENLKREKLLDIKLISQLDLKSLKKMIRPTGYFNQKATRLKNIAEHLENKYSGNLDSFFDRNLNEIREELLSLNGVGPETADSILLYAGNHSIFVVDAYTKRLCKRLPMETKPEYYEIQDFFQKELSKIYKNNEISKIYNELHALIVIFAKTYCKTKPNCEDCPLKKFCKYASQLI
ncbi:MAG: endonuclease [Thermoplasmatales archaeon SG8-52-3]|nr:MAG: endonuclease [Thermoplasmatales archaeon SG8-52-3]